MARSKSNKPQTRRPAITFEAAALLCPHKGVAENIARLFGLPLPDYDAIRAQHSASFHDMADSFGEALNERATEIHFQRLTGAAVGAAVGAGSFYSAKVIEARQATARAADGGEDDNAPYGLESKAQRTRQFAADLAMQAYAVLAAAHGAIDAYRELTGQDWKPYEPDAAPVVERKAAQAEIGAFEPAE